MADRLAGMPADEIQRAVMGAAKLVAAELLVRLESEVAVRIEHQLDALSQLFLTQKQGIGG